MYIIILVFFIIIIGIVVFLYNKGDKDILIIKQDENIIKEINNIRVESQGIGPNVNVLLNCKVIITDKRIIIKQKTLFKDKYVFRYIIYWAPAYDKKTGIQRGIPIAVVSKTDIKIVSTGKKSFLEINPQGTIALKILKLYFEHPDEIKNLIIQRVMGTVPNFVN